LSARIVRYADDFVVLCKGNVERPYALIQKVLTRLDLSLNEDKTHVVDTWKDSFDFLGFEIRLSRSWRTGKTFPNVQPAKKSIKRVKERIKSLTVRSNTPIPLDVIVPAVNRSLRGWVEYFHYRNCSQQLSTVRNFVERRMILHLRRRYKMRNSKDGFKAFSGEKLYQSIDLYKVPTTSGWRKRMPHGERHRKAVCVM
jgi:RNA-directed DNA polymerase